MDWILIQLMVLLCPSLNLEAIQGWRNGPNVCSANSYHLYIILSTCYVYKPSSPDLNQLSKFCRSLVGLLVYAQYRSENQQNGYDKYHVPTQGVVRPVAYDSSWLNQDYG